MRQEARSCVVVTGATGLVGNNVVRRLVELGRPVRVLTRRPAPRELAGLPVELSLGDVRDANSVRRALCGAAAVIHAAGHVHIGWTQAELHEQINVRGAENVAAAARELGLRLVHVSSVNALGCGSLEQPANEETAQPGLPLCPYVTSKRRGDEAVLEETTRGLSAVIAYPSFMLGPWDWKPSSGRMLLEVARGVTFYPLGAFSLADARDVAEALIAALELGAAGQKYVLAGHNLSYYEAWRRFAELGGARPPWINIGPFCKLVGGRGGDLWARLTGDEGPANSAAIGIVSRESCFSSERAERQLGYRVRPLAEIVGDAWDWFCERGYIKAPAGADFSPPPIPAQGAASASPAPAGPHFAVRSGAPSSHEQRAGHRR